MADLSWWQRTPQRVLDEDALLRDLVAKGTIVGYTWRRQQEGELWLTAELRLGNRTQAVELRFPERYPGKCPAMRPVPYGTQLSGHQFGGDGVLCLELGPDNWHSRFTAADLLVSAWKLLALETINKVEPIPIPSRHIETLGMEVRSKTLRLIVTGELLRALGECDSVVQLEYSVLLVDSAIVFWVTQVPTGATVNGLPPSVTDREKKLGLAVQVTEESPTPPGDLEGFRNYLRSVGVGAGQADEATGLVLLRSNKNITARFVMNSADKPVRKVALVTALGKREDRLGRITLATSDARVAIVGLGSLGSKVATNLVRSGVSTIALVDGDVLRKTSPYPVLPLSG